MRQSAGEATVAYSALFWFWIREGDRRPPVIRTIMESTRLRGRHIRYNYDTGLAISLGQAMPQASFFIPNEWQFAWGGRYATTLLLNSLSLRALYHLIAVQFGAQKYGLKGGAEHDLCLVLERDMWINDLELMSSLPREQIWTFIDHLTYGYMMGTPDQALQPFVPLGENKLALGPLGWLSSNVERNLLSLQARLQPEELNRQSDLFEIQMTKALVDTLKERWPLVVANRTFSLPEGKEEFDILVCDPETKTLLDLELRWILPPADPREVQHKSQACWEKVNQTERKTKVAAKNLKYLLNSAFGLSEIIEREWFVRGFAVVEGFGGVKSLNAAVPIVPEWVLVAGVRAEHSLRRLADWAVSLAACRT